MKRSASKTNSPASKGPDAMPSQPRKKRIKRSKTGVETCEPNEAVEKEQVVLDLEAKEQEEKVEPANSKGAAQHEGHSADNPPGETNDTSADTEPQTKKRPRKTQTTEAMEKAGYQCVCVCVWVCCVLIGVQLFIS